MIQEITYQDRFTKLQPWVTAIIEDIKKDLKNDHLRKEQKFVQKHFAKKFVPKLTAVELAPAYYQEISEGNEELADWISSRWMMKHTDIYHFFADFLSEINPKFDEITSLTDVQANDLMEEATAQFGAQDSYIFTILNTVAMSEDQLARFRKRAEEGEIAPKPIASSDDSIDAVKEKYESHIAKMAEKHEKKLLGLQKKYIQDVEGLKKQIAQMQRKLYG